MWFALNEPKCRVNQPRSVTASILTRRLPAVISNGWWAGVPLGFEAVERAHVSDTTRICVLRPMPREELLNAKLYGALGGRRRCQQLK